MIMQNSQALSPQAQNISGILEAQREFFSSGTTLDIEFRKRMLCKLLGALRKYEQELATALWNDMHKSYEEAYLTEFSILYGELESHMKNVGKWARRRKATTPLHMLPSRSYIVKEPLGCTLIIAPWNYPVQLLINPLIGAISAGCTAVLKPSPYVPAVSATLAKMISETFPQEYIALIQGHRDINGQLLQQRWDMIFFTGSPALGRTVMSAAAKHLTPVVLELGGKSPCIIDRTANIKVAARRVAWGKTLNCGQTCIAPDYILIHKEIKDAFIKEFAATVKELHGESFNHYVHMVNQKAFERVTGYLKDGRIAYGGRYDASQRWIEPTILEDVPLDAPVMQEEIFGPVFPMIVFDGAASAPDVRSCSGSTASGNKSAENESACKDASGNSSAKDTFSAQVTDFIKEREKPLALYWFGNEKAGWEVIRNTSSGGACLNDVIMHIANDNMPFGGVGNSGMGRYHKKESFECFSHTRSVLATPTWIDLPFRYMPYKLFPMIKRLLR